MQLERSSLLPSNWTDTKKLNNIYGIAKATSYLQSHKIIHRYLNPVNILEDDCLFPKISDFFLSKIYHQNFESMISQSTFVFKGRPIYVAPGINKTYCISGDAYSFTIIVYELLTHGKAFNDYNFIQFYIHKSSLMIKGKRPKFKHTIKKIYQDLITRCCSRDATKSPRFEEIANKKIEYINDQLI